MLSAMVLEKAPESECDGMVATMQHLGGLMVPRTSQILLAES
jgi:hypothetical protein